MKKIIILDYGLGNLFSILQASKEVGLSPEVSSEISKLKSADAVILPGVGAFGHAMSELGKRGLIDSLLDFASKERPLLGICLGMQLLMSKSEEFGLHQGLDLVQGDVRKFEGEIKDVKFRVPHMGWNSIISAKEDHPALKSLDSSSDMYFVHSYYVELKNKDEELTYTDYLSFRYTSSLVKNNIWAFQFHPEKSGKAGLQIYRNWASHFGL